MQESVHCILFTAVTFTWRAKLFVECRMVDPKMVSQICCSPPCATACRHCLHIARSSFSNFPLESFLNPKYFHTAALRFVGVKISSTSFDAILESCHVEWWYKGHKLLPKVFTLTIGNLENLHNRLVYRLTS